MRIPQEDAHKIERDARTFNRKCNIPFATRQGRQEERQEIEKQKLILAKLEEETELAQAKLNEKKQQEKEIKVFAFFVFLGS